MGVFSIVSVKETHSLLLVLSWEPVPDEILDLAYVHELNIVHMTVFLSLDHNIRGYALVAHSFGVGLMTFTGLVDLVSHSGRG